MKQHIETTKYKRSTCAQDYQTGGGKKKVKSRAGETIFTIL